MRPTVRSTSDGQVLFDAHAVSDPQRDLFDGAEPAEDNPPADAGGRGGIRLRRLPDGTKAAVRHYWRGGLVAHLSADHYLRAPLSQPRPWREWWILAQLHEMGLPVPRPIAARVRYSGITYRGDLATSLIPGCETLAQALEIRPLPYSTWALIGETIRQFHVWGADMPDLNAHNILLGSGRQVHILDFDRSRLRPPEARWQQANLQRLRRSLHKLATTRPAFHLESWDWSALMRGYSEETAAEIVGHSLLSSPR